MFGLKLKVMLATALAAAAPVAGYFVGEYYGAKQRIESASEQDLVEAAKRGALKIDTWINTNKSGLETLAATPDFAEMFLEEDKAPVKLRMKINADSMPWVRAAYFANPDGMQLARSNDDRLVQIGDRDYFKQARVGNLGQQLVISRTTGMPVLNLGAPVKNKSGSFAGVISYTIDVASITKTITQEKIGANGFKFILDPDGALISHPKDGEADLKNGSLPTYITHPIWKVKPDVSFSQDDAATNTSPKISTLKFKMNNEEFLGAITRADSGFYVATVLPMNEVNAPLIQQRNSALLWFALAMGLSFGIAFFVASALSRPIRLLTEATEGISMGQFDDEKLDNVQSNDEIRTLAQSIKKLSDSVRIAMKQFEGPQG
jgi:methyl-accepting chemotaxis protein